MLWEPRTTSRFSDRIMETTLVLSLSHRACSEGSNVLWVTEQRMVQLKALVCVFQGQSR